MSIENQSLLNKIYQDIRDYSVTVRGEIFVKLLNVGWSRGQIARTFNIDLSIVSKVIKAYKLKYPTQSKPKT